MKKSKVKVIQSHTGWILIGGAITLKVGALTGSLFLLVTGFGALVYAINQKFKGRDEK